MRGVRTWIAGMRVHVRIHYIIDNKLVVCEGSLSDWYASHVGEFYHVSSKYYYIFRINSPCAFLEKFRITKDVVMERRHAYIQIFCNPIYTICLNLKALKMDFNLVFYVYKKYSFLHNLRNVT